MSGFSRTDTRRCGLCHIHVNCTGSAQELVSRVTGSAIDPEPHLQYLKAKYGEIYGV